MDSPRQKRKNTPSRCTPCVLRHPTFHKITSLDQLRPEPSPCSQPSCNQHSNPGPLLQSPIWIFLSSFYLQGYNSAQAGRGGILNGLYQRFWTFLLSLLWSHHLLNFWAVHSWPLYRIRVALTTKTEARYPQGVHEIIKNRWFQGIQLFEVVLLNVSWGYQWLIVKVHWLVRFRFQWHFWRDVF